MKGSCQVPMRHASRRSATCQLLDYCTGALSRRHRSTPTVRSGSPQARARTVFSLMVIAQFWAYANDIYTPQAGERLFAVIAFGASSGAVFGPGSPAS